MCNCTSWFGPVLPTFIEIQNVHGLMHCYELHTSMLCASIFIIVG